VRIPRLTVHALEPFMSILISDPPVVGALTPQAIGRQDAARLLGISTRSFERAVARGQIPGGFRIGRRRVWPVKDLDPAVLQTKQGT
jgi:hypothetical protein